MYITLPLSPFMHGIHLKSVIQVPHVNILCIEVVRVCTLALRYYFKCSTLPTALRYRSINDINWFQIRKSKKVLAGGNLSVLSPYKILVPKAKIIVHIKIELWYILKFKNSRVAQLNSRENLILYGLYLLT